MWQLEDEHLSHIKLLAEANTFFFSITREPTQSCKLERTNPAANARCARVNPGFSLFTFRQEEKGYERDNTEFSEIDNR